MWKRLTIDDLRLALAEDEVQKLNELSKDSAIQEMCQSQLDLVADAYRGAFQAKGYTVDIRDHYIPPEYAVFILNYARWQIWTRFPGTESYALTDPRKQLLDQAIELLKNPYIGVSKPDYSDDPALSGDTSLTATLDASLTIPWLRMPPMAWQYGFPKAYWSELEDKGTKAK